MARGGWDEREHPRVPGGTPGGHGGEFVRRVRIRYGNQGKFSDTIFRVTGFHPGMGATGMFSVQAEGSSKVHHVAASEMVDADPHPGGWLAAVAESLPPIEPPTGKATVPHAPADGRESTIDELVGWTDPLDDGDGFGRFEGLEFWDAHNHEWRSGDEAQLEGQDRQDNAPDRLGIFIHGDDTYDDVTFRGGVTWRHAVATHEVEMADTAPDPDLEYYMQDDWGPGEWVPGSEIVVETGEGSGVEVGSWVTADGNSMPPGTITARPIIEPTGFDNIGMVDQDHPGARVFVADYLAKNRLAWAGGGYEILGHDGKWRQITGIERNYNVTMEGADLSEEITLRAGSYVIPDLDISEEVTIRRVP